MTHAEAIAAIKANWPTENYTMLREALTLACAALASPPASFHKRPFACSSASPCADCQHHEFCRSWLDGVGRCVKAPAPPASDQPGPTVINEDDGDVTIDFDYANDRVVSIRLGEESSGLSAFVDGESHALCPLDRVPPKVLALLRTEAKAVTLRQSDPPGLVQLVVALIEAANRRKAAHGVARVSAEYDEAKAYEALLACDLSAPASPAPDWQPIETAPTDGTPILVADATSVEEGVWQPETEDETECGGSVVVPGFDAGWWGSEWQPGAKQPTHWMRMPKPPSSPAPMPTKGDK